MYSAIKADTKSKSDLALTAKTRHSDTTGKNDYNRNSTCRQKRKLLQPLHSVDSVPQRDRNGLLLANGTVMTHCHVRRVAPVGPVPPAPGNAVQHVDATQLASTWLCAPRKCARSRSERPPATKTNPKKPQRRYPPGGRRACPRRETVRAICRGPAWQVGLR